MLIATKLPACAIWLMLGVSSAALTTAAQAQSGTPTAAEGDQAGEGGLEEIVVTAQRRREKLQEVPIAVTTLGGRMLESAGVVSTEQIMFVTPGFVVNRQRRNASPFIRGIGSQASGVGIEAAVSTYVDGVYYFSASSSLFSLNNTQRIEVLKGPQGTLFGRNATGGLVNIITRDPQVEPHAEGTVSYGNYKTKEGNFYLTGGSGKLAADLAIYAVRQGRGYGVDLVNGQDINKQNETSLRSKVVWQASDDDKIILSGDWSNDKSTFGVSSNVVPGSRLTGGFGFRGSPYDSQADAFTYYRQKQWGGSLRYEHSFDDLTLSLLSAYRNLDSAILADVDDTPNPVITALVNVADTSFQNEILLSGTTGRLDFTVGGFIFYSNSAFNPQSVRSPAVAAQNVDIFGRIHTESYAGFTQGTYDLGGDTKLTAGLRYTLDRRRFNARTIAVAGNPTAAGTVLFTRDELATFPKLTWRLALDHKFAPDILGYVSYNRGFKSGTFSASNPTQPVVRPEVLDAVEGGLKSEFFNRRLRANASVFHYWSKDIQLAKVSANGAAQQLLNAARAKFYGGEFEVTAAPDTSTGNLQITAGVAYLHGRYTSFPGGLISVPGPAGGNGTRVGDLAGKTTIRSPKFTFNGSIDYTIPVGPGELGANVTYYHNSGFFWEPDNRLRQPAFDVVNAQISYAFGNDKQYKIRVWGRNLTNEVYYSFAAGAVFGDKQTAERPRTYGVALDFSF